MHSLIGQWVCSDESIIINTAVTQILIGYVLLHAHFGWLVGNMNAYPKNLFQSRSK